MQQPFNEVIASLVAEKLGISHVPYTLLWDDDTPYSVCEDFVTPDTELVSAWRVMQSMRKGQQHIGLPPLSELLRGVGRGGHGTRGGSDDRAGLPYRQ